MRAPIPPLTAAFGNLVRGHHNASAEEIAVMQPIPLGEVFTFLFLMLGPIKVIGPFAAITQKASPALARQLALRSSLYATGALLLAALLGQSLLDKYSISVPVLALAAGVILFLVALQTVMHQFSPPGPAPAAPEPTLRMAMSPLAFPTIVTPHGIAAVIVFMALSPGLPGRLAVVAVFLAIMALNIVAMLTARHILKPLGIGLQILGAVLGIIQVALGLDIMLGALGEVWRRG